MCEVGRGQDGGVNSFLLPLCESWESNSDHLLSRCLSPLSHPAVLGHSLLSLPCRKLERSIGSSKPFPTDQTSYTSVDFNFRSVFFFPVISPCLLIKPHTSGSLGTSLLKHSIL